MKRIINTSEILGTVDTPDGVCEVCASAEANYDDLAGLLTVQLDSFLRTTDIRAGERYVFADWLPGSETITEPVKPDETIETAHDIFHRWDRKVRRVAPMLQSAAT